jgi:hypothetical protein
MANTLKFGNGEWYGKKDTILAYNDLNSNYKPLPFNFSRDSKATVVNKDGLIEEVGSGQPRIDFKDNTKGALLLEPSRSNLITNSSNLSTWNSASTTQTFVDDLINPSNVLGGSKLTQLSNNGGYAWLPRTFTGNETFSVFVKKGSSNFARLYAANNTVYFDIVNGTIETEAGSDITDKSIIYYGNGWFRISMSVNSTIESFVRIYPASSGSSVGGTDSLFVYGAQLEQGSYATSYIPTSGSAVTRLADVCTNGGNEQVINSSEGVFYFEGSALDDDGTDRKITLSDGSLNNAINFGFSRFSGNINAEVKSGGVLQTSGFGATGIAQDNNNKFALSWGGGVSKFYVNGTLASSYTSVTSPIGMNVLNFSLSSGFQKSYLNCKDIRVYNTALSDSELAALTQV